MTSCSMMRLVLVLVLVLPVMVELQPILVAQCPIVLPSPAVLYHTGTIHENILGVPKNVIILVTFQNANFPILR